nr:MAG TPA: hypothetical protein [Caudoviricetes sp.]
MGININRFSNYTKNKKLLNLLTGGIRIIDILV